MATAEYVSPFSTRYSSKEMKRLFSDDWKFGMWRRFWLQVATVQRRLGVSEITEQALVEMAEHLDDIDYDLAAKLEKKFRHDVMAHAHTFGAICKAAAPIIHHGQTSCDPTDNTELIQMKEGLRLLTAKLAKVIYRLALFAKQFEALPTLGFTHIQAAQPVTVGKRAAMWLQDLAEYLAILEELIHGMKIRGIKGVTGTQDAMLDIFKGDRQKIFELERGVAERFGFSKVWRITGQTYPRMVDTMVLQALAGLAASIHKICLDIRVLQHLKELEEPFEKSQVASSGMPYKRNPMRAERACGIARHIMVIPMEALMTQAFQFFERTLDDSAGRRVYIPEAFLATDAILIICQNVFEGLVVYPKMIRRHLQEELPFLTAERILNAMVKCGASRQEAHEEFRVLSQEAGRRVKEEGLPNELVLMLKKTEYFRPIWGELDALLDPALFIGVAPEQTEDFLAEVRRMLARYPDAAKGTSELKV